MSEQLIDKNAALIAALRRKAKLFRRRFRRGRNETQTLLLEAAYVLAKSEQELAKMRLDMAHVRVEAFTTESYLSRDKIKELEQKLTEQSAIVEAAKQWNRDSDGDGDRDPSEVRRSELTAILYAIGATEQ